MSYSAFLSVLCGFFIKPQRSQSAAEEPPLTNQFIADDGGQSSSIAEIIGRIFYRIFCRRFSQSHLGRDYNGCLVAKVHSGVYVLVKMEGHAPRLRFGLVFRCHPH